VGRQLNIKEGMIKEKGMKKGQISKTLIATALLGAVCGSPAMAGGGPVSMEALQRQMQDLINQNNN